jgi:type I restriction enzyme S subunit
MNAEHLLAHYEKIADAPDAIARMRRFVLDLAIRGKLVPQDPSDEPASELLKEIAADGARTGNGRARRNCGSIQVRAVENTPFDAPSGWVWAPFGNIVISRDGERIPVSKEERNRRAKLFDYYGASGIIDKIDNYLFDKPLLLIGEDGANLINRSTPIAFIARGKYWVNNHAHVLDGSSEEFLRYLELFINAIDLKPYVTGTAQPKMNQAKMNSIPVALPPFAEQRRIVTKVDELMALCDRLEAARQTREATRDRLTATSLARLNTPDPETFHADARFALEALPALTTRPDQIRQLRQTILNLAVRGKLVPQDAKDEPASARLAHDAPDLEGRLGAEIPSNWRWSRVEDVAEARLGKMLDKAKNKGRPHPNALGCMFSSVYPAEVTSGVGTKETFQPR